MTGDEVRLHQVFSNLLRKRLLERRKVVVTAAAAAEDALEHARTERFDFVISGLGLPGKDGYELMAELRGAYGFEGVALSGYGTERDISQGQAQDLSSISPSRSRLTRWTRPWTGWRNASGENNRRYR